MNRRQREPWLKVVADSPSVLCDACRYSDTELDGDGEWTCFRILTCEHPIETVHNNDEAYVGSDCWGFRPAKGMTFARFADGHQIHGCPVCHPKTDKGRDVFWSRCEVLGERSLTLSASAKNL